MATSNHAALQTDGNAPGDPSWVDLISLDLDASYPAGGYDFAVGTAERTALDAVIGKGKTIYAAMAQTVHAAPSTAASTLDFVWDAANDTLMAFISTTGVEAAAGDADMSGVTGLVLVLFSR